MEIVDGRAAEFCIGLSFACLFAHWVLFERDTPSDVLREWNLVELRGAPPTTIVGKIVRRLRFWIAVLWPTGALVWRAAKHLIKSVLLFIPFGVMAVFLLDHLREQGALVVTPPSPDGPLGLIEPIQASILDAASLNVYSTFNQTAEFTGAPIARYAAYAVQWMIIGVVLDGIFYVFKCTVAFLVCVVRPEGVSYAVKNHEGYPVLKRLLGQKS